MKHAGNAPVAYLQFGDGPDTYADASFRRVLSNAIGWAASPSARQWAVDRRAATGAFRVSAPLGVGLCLPQLGPHVTAEVVREFCVRAEELGYSSLWVQDHFLWPLLQPDGPMAGAPMRRSPSSTSASWPRPSC